MWLGRPHDDIAARPGNSDGEDEAVAVFAASALQAGGPQREELGAQFGESIGCTPTGVAARQRSRVCRFTICPSAMQIAIISCKVKAMTALGAATRAALIVSTPMR